jgi:hypothetical protein
MLFDQQQGDRAAMGQAMPTLAASMGAFDRGGGLAFDGSGPPAPTTFDQSAADAFGKLPPQAMPGMLGEMNSTRRERQYEQRQGYDQARTTRIDQEHERPIGSRASTPTTWPR